MAELSMAEKKLILDIIYRLFETIRIDNIYIYGTGIEFLDRYFCDRVHEMDSNRELDNEILCIYCNELNYSDVKNIIKKYENDNYILLISDKDLYEGYSMKFIGSEKRISLLGKGFIPVMLEAPSTFKVLAIIHLYNEVDVIRKTTEYLLSEGIDVYLVDNWSTDGSYDVIENLAKANLGRVFYERFPSDGKKDFYDWYHQLERTERISRELNYNWFIHYDADEYRISPWRELTLRETIYLVDSLGFNAIENTVINFKITNMGNDSIFMKDSWFDFGHKVTHFEQTKTWKKSDTIELKDSGGHIAKIDNPRVFPLKILNRHYPLRSYEQAQRKVFIDRKPRFSKENSERGWHGQYNVIKKAEDIITDTSQLYKWGENTYEELYIPLFLGCGIEVESVNLDIELENFNINADTEICIYGAGKVGQLLYKYLRGMYKITHWVDKNYCRITPKFGRVIESPQVILNSPNTYVIIAVEKEDLAKEICNNLIDIGFDKKRIIWRRIKKK